MPTLKELRVQAGVTQAALASILGVRGPAQVSEWETGRTRPSWRLVPAMAEALGVSVGVLAEAIVATPEHDGTDHRRIPDRERQAVRRAQP
jgi:transcriptional regulator with XRE-family HTH domain